MINRILSDKLKYFAGLFPVVSLTGPRQSGKTTLVKAAFPGYTYYSLEDIDIRNLAISDPKGFLSNNKQGLIIDEIQRVPELFSYIQSIVDESNVSGQFVITGSQNFLLLEKISQSLAGRVAILKLLPLSLQELKSGGLLNYNFIEFIFNGFYPRIYDKKIPATGFYPFYIQTYIERDVKLIRNISNQNTFVRFLKMCAGRTGQILNVSDLANACGISQVTAKSWLSVLEASFVIYFLQPHYRNYNKRLVKMPKMYFYDTGVVCSLLGIKSEKQVQLHYLYGAIFENFIINEMLKSAYNKADVPAIYYWRDKTGREIDVIIEKSDKLIPIEIKAGKTIVSDFFKNIKYWNKLSKNNKDNSYVIYGGDDNFSTKEGSLVSWRKLDLLLNLI